MKKLMIFIFLMLSLVGCKREDAIHVENNGDFTFSSSFTTIETTEKDNFYKATEGLFGKIEGLTTQFSSKESLETRISPKTQKKEDVKTYTLAFSMSGNLDKITTGISKKTGYIQKITNDVYIIYPEGDKAASLTTTGSARIETIVSGAVKTIEKVESVESPYVIFLNDNKGKLEEFVDLQTHIVKYGKDGKKIEEESNNMLFFIIATLGAVLGFFLLRIIRSKKK